VAVTGQVDSVDPERAREVRDDRTPDAGVHRPAMQQHQWRPVTGRLDG